MTNGELRMKSEKEIIASGKCRSKLLVVPKVRLRRVYRTIFRPLKPLMMYEKKK